MTSRSAFSTAGSCLLCWRVAGRVEVTALARLLDAVHGHQPKHHAREDENVQPILPAHDRDALPESFVVFFRQGTEETGPLAQRVPGPANQTDALQAGEKVTYTLFLRVF